MRIPVVVSIFVMLLLPAASARGAAQQGIGDEPHRASGAASHRVGLPVIVRDKRGAAVANLTAADLSLLDNGRPQVIESLAGATDLAMHVGLLIDTSRGMLRALDSERKAAAKFADLSLTAGAPGAPLPNQVFLIHFDRQVELLEDFTGSRDKLQKDLDQMGPTEKTANTEGPETSDSDSGGSRNFRTGSPQLYDAVYLAADQLMKTKQGRKALIVFSNGLDDGSKESLDEAIEAAEHTGTPIYTVYFRGDARPEGAVPEGGRRGGGWPGSGSGWPGGRPGGGGYPGGGRRGPRLSPPDGKKVMEQIATRTGGLYFEAKKTAELDDIYSQIAADIRAQYLLTYSPRQAGSSDTEFHKIELKATKGDLGVVAPEGYYETPDATQ